MRIVGVLDLLGRRIVRGVGGRREEYRPIVSRLTSSCDPLAVACAYREVFGLEELYLADLDAIGGAAPCRGIYADLRREGFRLQVDAGIRQVRDVDHLREAGVETIVAGLETLAGLDVLGELARELGSRLVFSLDLRQGQPVVTREQASSRALAQRAVELGVKRILVLDLARVGEGQGPGTEELCADLVCAHPGVEISAGGGIRGREDLARLRQAGVAAVLVASALHDGRLTREDLLA
jgi:phosphoribosylformimino-5-aminoimidazole carboxamide ribotide isomerase